MTRRPPLVALSLLLIASPSLSAQNPVRDSMKGLFDVTQGVIMATARELSPELYAYRPTDEVRSAGQILAHVADAQYAFCSSAAGERSPMTESIEQTHTTKPRIVEALEGSFTYCERVFGTVTDATGGESVDLFGTPNTRLGALGFNNAHNYEHYGNLVTYMRINGIVPPSSR